MGRMGREGWWGWSGTGVSLLLWIFVARGRSRGFGGAGVDASEEKRAESVDPAEALPGLRRDLGVLIKLRLNVFVLITAFFGFLLGSGGWGLDWWRLLHVLVGTAAAAFGSAAFNQLMEVDLDARMKRTADRPLPARRMDPLFAFAVGWLLSAAGIIHLAVMVGVLPAVLAAATVAIYVFVYTPLKRLSSVNTLVGAVPGAVPPVIGWTAVEGRGFEVRIGKYCTDEQWQQACRIDPSTPCVVQEYFDPVQLPVVTNGTDQIHVQPMFLTLGLASLRGRYVGTLSRISSVPVTNVAQKGMVQAVFY